MKYLLASLILSFFLTLFSHIYEPFFYGIHTFTINVAVFIEKPIYTVVNRLKELSNDYILLVNTEQENRLLNNHIANLEIKNHLLQSSCKNNHSLDNYASLHLILGRFGLKANFLIDKLYIVTDKRLDLARNSCVVLSRKLKLIGVVNKKDGNGYDVKTVFNSDFLADVYIEHKDSRYRAFFMGSKYGGIVKFFDSESKINAKDGVYTSGVFGKYPAGIEIGKVKSIINKDYYKIAKISIDRSFFNDYNIYVLCKKRQQ